MSADAILGTFVKIGTMADGTPRLVLDLQCTLSEVAAMGLIPGVPFAIARLSKEAAGKPAVAPVSQPQEQKEKPGQLCVMACTFCADTEFQRWLGVDTEEEAKALILEDCRIQSRKELDSNHQAAQIFLNQFRGPFMAYKASLARPK